MKRENRLLPITLCASAMLHAGAFFFLAVHSESPAGTPEPKQEAAFFSLVTISVPDEPIPVELPPEPEPVIPEPQDRPAEIFIAVEEMPLPPEAEEPVVRTEVPAEVPAALPPHSGAAVSGAPERTGSRAGPEAANTAALAESYIRRNFTYIQRRIRDRLVYPSPARRAGIQGVAELTFTIHEDGRISAVSVRTSSGHEVLDQAAMAAVHAAAPFPPPAAQARLAIPVSFRIR